MKKLEQALNGSLSKIVLGILLAGGGFGVGALEPWQEKVVPGDVLKDVRHNSAQLEMVESSLSQLTKSIDRLNDRIDQVIMAHHNPYDTGR